MNLTEQLRKTFLKLDLSSWNATSWDCLAGMCCGVFDLGVSATMDDRVMAMGIAQKALIEVFDVRWPEKLNSSLETSRLMDDAKAAYLLQSQVLVGKVVLSASMLPPTIYDLKKCMAEIGPRAQTGIPIDMKGRGHD